MLVYDVKLFFAAVGNTRSVKPSRLDPLLCGPVFQFNNKVNEFDRATDFEPWRWDHRQSSLLKFEGGNFPFLIVFPHNRAERKEK